MNFKFKINDRIILILMTGLLAFFNLDNIFYGIQNLIYYLTNTASDFPTILFWISQEGYFSIIPFILYIITFLLLLLNTEQSIKISKGLFLGIFVLQIIDFLLGIFFYNSNIYWLESSNFSAALLMLYISRKL
jgi:hypothetical protein